MGNPEPSKLNAVKPILLSSVCWSTLKGGLGSEQDGFRSRPVTLNMEKQKKRNAKKAAFHSIWRSLNILKACISPFLSHA